MSLVCFDPSFVTVERSFVVCQIVGCPVILSLSVLHEFVNKSVVQCR